MTLSNLTAEQSRTLARWVGSPFVRLMAMRNRIADEADAPNFDYDDWVSRNAEMVQLIEDSEVNPWRYIKLENEGEYLSDLEWREQADWSVIGTIGTAQIVQVGQSVEDQIPAVYVFYPENENLSVRIMLLDELMKFSQEEIVLDDGSPESANGAA